MNTQKTLHDVQNDRKIFDVRFPSGGSRYIFYIGAYAALAQTRIWDDIQRLTGTSAGAMISLFIGLNVSPNELYRDLRSRDPDEATVENLLGERIGSLTGNNPDGVTPFTRSGEPLLANIKKSISNAINQFLNIHEVTFINNYFLDGLRKRFNEPDPEFTFTDLEILREYFPQYFKYISFESVVLPTAEARILNYHTKPNADMARACYSSAAIQGMCAPIEIDGEKYIDGGVARYICLGKVGPDTNANIPNPDVENTLLIVCTDHFVNPQESSSHKALYGSANETSFFAPILPEKIFRNYITPYLVNIPANENTANWNANYREIAENYPLNTIVIDSCGVLPPEFARAKKLERQLYASGYLDTMNYLTNHELGITECEADDLYQNILDNFKCIYSAILDGSSSQPMWSDYMIHAQTNKDAKTKCMYLHQGLKNNIESPEALAFTYAVEFYNNAITADELFNDVYLQAFKMTGTFASSNILGEKVFSTETLKKGLKSFSIFNSESKMTEGARSEIVMNQLMKIGKFSEQASNKKLAQNQI